MTDDGILDELLRKALESIRGEFHDRTWQAFWGVVVAGQKRCGDSGLHSKQSKAKHSQRGFSKDIHPRDIGTSL